MRNEDRVITGFMCKVDWDHELGTALGGTNIFVSQADLIANKKCTDECGIVEVEIRLKQVVRESDYGIEPDKFYNVVSRENGKRIIKKISGKDLLKKRNK